MAERSRREKGKRTDARRLLDSIVRGLEPDSYQRNPYFPDLLNQPDLLVVPELGKLVAIFTYRFPKRVSWTSSLAALEDLFEAKLNIGNYTIAIAVALGIGNASVARRDDPILLLQNTFDVFLAPNAWEAEGIDQPFTSFLTDASPKADFFGLWDAERESVEVNLRRFSEEKYKPLVDKDNKPEPDARTLEEGVLRQLRDQLHLPITTEPLVENVKGQLGRLGKRYWFEFAFGFADRPRVVMDLIRSERYGSRRKIRYLMTKARLLRYQLDGDQFWPRRPPFQPVLLVDGNITGPDHDPYRYVRALVSVGWEILRTDQLEDLPRRLVDADL